MLSAGDREAVPCESRRYSDARRYQALIMTMATMSPAGGGGRQRIADDLDRIRQGHGMFGVARQYS